jgi:hypothetical protein
MRTLFILIISFGVTDSLLSVCPEVPPSSRSRISCSFSPRGGGRWSPFQMSRLLFFSDDEHLGQGKINGVCMGAYVCVSLCCAQNKKIGRTMDFRRSMCRWQEEKNIESMHPRCQGPCSTLPPPLVVVFLCLCTVRCVRCVKQAG